MNKFIVANDQLTESPFDSIRHIDDQGNEFWFARELMNVLAYAKWQMFKGVVDNAQENIETLGLPTVEHFLPVEVKNTDASGKRKRGRTGLDYKLSRLACYHVALCCDSRGNDSVKAAKHYFAIKTREAEVVIPRQNDRLRELVLQNQILSQQIQLRQLDHTMLTMHGKETVLALRGMADQIVREEIKTTEVVEPDTGRATNILTANQLKEAFYKRTGHRLKSMKQFTDKVRQAGRDDLLEPVRRSHVSEYIKPEHLDEAIAVVCNSTKSRQLLLGE